MIFSAEKQNSRGLTVPGKKKTLKCVKISKFKFQYASLMCNRWLGMRLECFANLITFSVAIYGEFLIYFSAVRLNSVGFFSNLNGTVQFYGIYRCSKNDL